MGFTCDFVRHNCAHAELFRANYQRTNRTKGSKILRCFPHCCPDHVTRSFCGAPLYLDVHWHDANEHDANEHDANDANTTNPANVSNALVDAPRASDEQDADVPLLLVFGRFRLQQEPGFGVGELVAPDAIARSVQSDENPNGEWIKSALLQRPHRHTMNAHRHWSWRFEINSSARWFYGWESGVAKSHRLREHVLDVLVTTPASPHHHGDWLRVVATAQSPPFKMISFRRATPEALTLLSASSAPTAPLPTSVHRTLGTRARDHDHTKTHGHDNDDHVAIKSEPMPPSRTTTRPVARTRAQAPQVHAPPVQRPPATRTASVSDPAAELRDLAVVWHFLQRMALRSVLPLTPAMARVVQHQVSQLVGPRPPPSPVDETLAHLLALTGKDDRTQRSRLSERAPSPLLKVACHVALWLWWDTSLHAQWRVVVDDAAAVLLDGRALRRRFERGVVGWLWTRLDAFLARADWTLPALVAAIEHDNTRHDVAGEMSRSSSSNSPSWAYEAFVAHVRERFADHQRAFDAMRRATKRRRIGLHRRLPTREPDASAAPLVTTRTSRPSAFDGKWVATLDDLQTEPCHSDHDHDDEADQRTQTTMAADETPWRLEHLMWFWREFSALEIYLDASTATLRVRSLVSHDDDQDDDEQRTLTTSALMLVLDHRCRWARHLPSGVSTLAVALGNSRVGDYVGKVSASGREIHLNCYAWPVVTTARRSTSVSNDDLYATCFQLHFRAATTATTADSSERFHVRVSVNRGRIDPRPLGLEARASAATIAAEIHARPLPQRLALVPQWRPSGEWLVEYHRVA